MKNMLRAGVALAMLLCTSIALAGYFPLQPGHQGNWYDPGNVGEGIELSIVETADTREIFATVYLLTDDGPVWTTAGGNWSQSFVDYSGTYILTVYQRLEPGEPPERLGRMEITPGFATLTVLYQDDLGNRRDAVFERLTRPNEGNIGACNWTGFYPRPPAANPGWCHD